jgi:hypothetical protein
MLQNNAVRKKTTKKEAKEVWKVEGGGRKGKGDNPYGSPEVVQVLWWRERSSTENKPLPIRACLGFSMKSLSNL